MLNYVIAKCILLHHTKAVKSGFGIGLQCVPLFCPNFSLASSTKHLIHVSQQKQGTLRNLNLLFPSQRKSLMYTSNCWKSNPSIYYSNLISV